MQMISARLDCLGEAINIPILAWAVAHAVYCCVSHLGGATCAFQPYLLESKKYLREQEGRRGGSLDR